MNKVTNWQYEKPTEEGVYLCCYGDVESPHNMFIIHAYGFDRTKDGIYRALDSDINRIISPPCEQVKYAKLEFNDE